MAVYPFDAVIFDLDGVITKTALVHSAAWKSMFDEYLMARSKKKREIFREFTHERDYLQYVDGKPRYDGVKSFLESRGIKLPFGVTADPHEAETICGLGNKKNQVFNDILEEQGVEVYESTVSLIRELKEKSIKVGVASSSKNCEGVLQATGLADLMETRVDGIVSAEIGLKGKPEPGIFTTAADNLGVTYDRAVVVEDAVSGVQAGKKGNFGLVLGLAREDNHRALQSNGADLVVSDIEEIGFQGMVDWFNEGLPDDSWSLTYHDYDPAKERNREVLLAVGNGYFGTRGAMEEAYANEYNYPGTYMSGVYNRLISKVASRDIENEDLVNVINWLPLNMRIGDGKWFDANTTNIMDIRRRLDFRNGVLEREMVICDDLDRKTRIVSRRMASMHDPHLAALEYTITPLNYSGTITIRSGLYGDHINDGVERYQQLNQQHLEAVDQGQEDKLQYLIVRTTQSATEIAATSKSNVFINGKKKQVKWRGLQRNGPQDSQRGGRVEASFKEDLAQGDTLVIHKICCLCNSCGPYQDKPFTIIREKIGQFDTFDDLLSASEGHWKDIWDKLDIRVEGDRLAQKLLRLHLYHMMVTTSPLNSRIDFGIPARGLHGEAYRGHIFWDEIFILPIYNLHLPDASRSVLMYRFRRLHEARKYARESGYQGAMFPWQSGSSGREETQVLHLNPVSGEWGPDHSALQRHVSLAIAFNIWQYYHMTDDLLFIESYGLEMFLEICRFWASKCQQDVSTGRYSIDKVMGPDEFHEKSPGAEEGGLKDNAYTNLMVSWAFDHAFILLSAVAPIVKKSILEKTGLNKKELDSWKDMAGKLNLVISEEGIIAQYDGYFALKELDWDEYREKYDNIYRLDRLLKAEGKSSDEYKVAKQADTLMTFYNLDKAMVDGLLKNLGYKAGMPDDYFTKNLEYYLARTSHGSTLSRVVHARLAVIAGNADLSWQLYSDALGSDYQDVQGGTTAEGIHAGVMAGTIWVALTAYAGLNLDNDIASFNPALPSHWKKISFGFTFKGDEYYCEVGPGLLKITVESFDHKQVKIKVGNKEKKIQAGKETEIKL